MFATEELEDIVNEVGTLKTLDHPNILRVYDLYEDEENFYIVTELCTGGELFDKIIDHGFLDEQTGRRTREAQEHVMALIHQLSLDSENRGALSKSGAIRVLARQLKDGTPTSMSAAASRKSGDA